MVTGECHLPAGAARKLVNEGLLVLRGVGQKAHHGASEDQKLEGQLGEQSS